MPNPEIENLAWDKQDGLLPAIVQDALDGCVLMLGYMSREALQATLASGRVTFFSRSRQRLWSKGESSGNHLELVSWQGDCDADALLIQARPAGPTCHRGTRSCFAQASGGFLGELGATIARRDAERPPGSYTTSLLEAGPRRIAQKVGEEGVETALAGVAEADDVLLGEAADLVFHLQVLLQVRGLAWADVLRVLQQRHGRAAA